MKLKKMLSLLIMACIFLVCQNCTAQAQSFNNKMEIVQFSQQIDADDQNILVFMTDPDNKAVYYNDTRYNPITGYYTVPEVVNRIWRKLTPLPEGCVPGQIKIITMLTNESNGVPVLWRPFYVYLTDTYNNCVWGAVLDTVPPLVSGNNAYDRRITLKFAKPWTKLLRALPNAENVEQ